MFSIFATLYNPYGAKCNPKKKCNEHTLNTSRHTSPHAYLPRESKHAKQLGFLPPRYDGGKSVALQGADPPVLNAKQSAKKERQGLRVHQCMERA